MKEKFETAEGEGANSARGFVTIGTVFLVGKIDDLLMGHELFDFLINREATDAGIKYGDWRIVLQTILHDEYDTTNSVLSVSLLFRLARMISR